MYTSLKRYALASFKCAPDLAEDLAAEVIANCLAADIFRADYCFAAIRNQYFRYWRDRRTRNEDYAPPLDDEGQPIEFVTPGILPGQENHILATECAIAIGQMPAELRDVMVLVAQEYEDAEICDMLGLTSEALKRRKAAARSLLRNRDAYEIERKKGHHRYIGIRKRGRIWEARVKSGNAEEIVGYYKSAAEAAKAYDARNKELKGTDASLNFSGDSPGRAKVGRKRRQLDMDEIKRMFAEGTTVAEIARRFKIDHKTVNKRLAEHGIASGRYAEREKLKKVAA